MVLFPSCEYRLVDGVLKAVSPLLYVFMYDKFLYDTDEEDEEDEEKDDDDRVINWMAVFLTNFEYKLDFLACFSESSTANCRLKLAGILVTLLFAWTSDHTIIKDDHGETMIDFIDFEFNIRNCKRICKMIRRLCEQERQSASIKTLVYSSMPVFCDDNPLHSASVLHLLIERIDFYKQPELLVISANRSSSSSSDTCLVNIDACIELVTREREDGSAVTEITAVLVEPLDVLLQALEMCLRAHNSKWPPRPNTNSANFLAPTHQTCRSQTRAIQAVDAMARVYLQSGGDDAITGLVGQHLLQVEAKCRRHTIDGASLTAEAMLSMRVQCLQIVRQLELGIVEALVEHTLMRETAKANTYANVSLLLSRHEAIRSLFNARLNELRREQEQLSVIKIRSLFLNYIN